MKDIIKDVLLAHYTSNEKYHDSKDRLVWLSASVFLALLISIWGWFFAHPCFLAAHRPEITVLLAVVFGPACIFTWCQNRLKCMSVRKTSLFLCLIKDLESGNKKPTYTDLKRITEACVPRWHGALAKEALPGAFILWPLMLLSVSQFVLVWMPFISCFLALLR